MPEAKASAEFLMAEMLGVGRLTAVTQGTRALTVKQSHQYWDWIVRRGKRFPIAYILGYQPFLGSKIEVTRDSLVPRPETEEPRHRMRAPREGVEGRRSQDPRDRHRHGLHRHRLGPAIAVGDHSSRPISRNPLSISPRKTRSRTTSATASASFGKTCFR